MGNYHARFGVGENPEITSKDYLSLLNSALNTWNSKMTEIWNLLIQGPEAMTKQKTELTEKLKELRSIRICP